MTHTPHSPPPAQQVRVLGTDIGSGALLPDCLPRVAEADLAEADLAKADLIVAGAALLARWRDHAPKAAVLALGGPEGVPFAVVRDAVIAAWQAGKRVVVLADGDPLYFGLGASLARALPAGALSIVPGISALQAACATIGLPWSGVASVSLHGRTDWFPLAAAVRRGGPVCVLGDARNGPATVAAWLLDRGADWLRVHLFTDLHTQQARHMDLSLSEAAALTDFIPAPTLLLIPASPPRGPRLTLDPHLPMTDRQLITKGPIRATALAGLDLTPDDTVWDIGAGSGSVAFGAAALAWNGQVWAVERHPERLTMLHANRRHVAALNVELVAAQAPDGLAELPDPDAVFVGGGLAASSNLADSSCLAGQDLLDALYMHLRPGGRLVAACVLFSSLERLRAFARAQDVPLSVTLVQAAESAPLGGDSYMQAHNPVFVACLRKSTG